ncbi:MAG TPA: peptidylprolyl isomerase [Acidobacteriota bacterium]|nr:peptidylprolyl isomerase [Acidobacteriota bacterium]
MKRALYTLVIICLIALSGVIAMRTRSQQTSVNISKAEMENFLKGLNPMLLMQLSGAENGKADLVKDLKRAIALGQEADRLGITAKPETQSQLDLARKQILINIYKETPEGQKAKVSKEDIDQYYKTNPTAFDDFLNKNADLKKLPNASELKGQFAELSILSERAEKAGAMKDPGFKLKWLVTKANVVGEKTVEQIQKSLQVSDAEINKYYDEHKTDTFEEVKASHILLPTKELNPGQPQPGEPKSAQKVYTADEAKQKAAELIQQAQGGADFAKLAAQFSLDTGSAKEGGDLGYFGRGQMVKAFEDAAFTLKPGEITPSPVITEFGVHIIKVTDHRTRPLDKPLQDQIRDMLKGKQLEERLDAMVRASQISVAADFEIPEANPQQLPGRSAPPGHP